MGEASATPKKPKSLGTSSTPLARAVAVQNATREAPHQRSQMASSFSLATHTQLVEPFRSKASTVRCSMALSSSVCLHARVNSAVDVLVLGFDGRLSGNAGKSH